MSLARPLLAAGAACALLLSGAGIGVAAAGAAAAIARPRGGDCLPLPPIPQRPFSLRTNVT